jgi:paraquat-inducible protein B
MSKPANKKVIGVFVLGAIALLVVALVVFGSGKIFKKTVPVVFYFEGSVKGLNVGSPLVIRGVQVGSVTDVVLQYNPKDLSLRIPVYADFDPEKVSRVGGIGGARTPPGKPGEQLKKLIERGLRAQLQMQSILTGLLMINLDFLPNTPVRLLGTDPKQLEIPTVPTAMEELTQKIEKLPIEEIFNRLANTLEQIEKVIGSPEVEGGVKDLAQSMKEVRALIKSINAEIKPLTAGIQDTLQDTRTFVKHADTEMQGMTSRLDGVMKDTQNLVQNADRQVGPVASDLKKTLEETRGALAQAQKTMQAAEAHYAQGSAFYFELTEALQGLNEASRSTQLLVEYLKRRPDAVIWGKGKRGGK